jgi:DNA-binding NarL/FixJ family response regulator
MSISVLLADDHAIWRGGVRSLLEDTEFEVIGESSSGRDAVEKVQELRPRLVLLDIRMAGGDGLDALLAIKALDPTVAVVMLTTYDSPIYLARAIAGGAAGYLLKGVDREKLLRSLRAVAEGEMLLRQDDLKKALKDVAPESQGAPDLPCPLSDREIEVLKYVSTGLINREIAALLFISESTVKTHIEHIIRKLGVSDRVQAAVWAVKSGIA